VWKQILLACLLLTPPAYGQQMPVINVSVPAEVQPGELVIVSAEIDKGAMPPNLQVVKFQWAVWQDGQPKKDVIAWPDNSKVVFAAGNSPRVFTVLLDVDCLYGVQTPDKALIDPQVASPDLIVRKVKVLAGGVDPVPVPIPVPAPIAVGKLDVFLIYQPETETAKQADLRANLALRNWNGDGFAALSYSQVDSKYRDDEGKPVVVVRYRDAGNAYHYTEPECVSKIEDVTAIVEKLRDGK